MTKQIKRRQALMADVHVAAAFRLSWWNLTLKNTGKIKILLHSNLLKLTVLSILDIVAWPSRLKICTKQQNRLVNPSAKACWVWRLDNECPYTLALFLWTKTQRWIFSSKLIFARSSSRRASEHRMKNAVNKRSQNPGNQVTVWGWDMGRHAWLWILWKSTAQAPLSIVTSLGCSLVSLSLSLSLSLGADRIIFCIRAEAGPTLHTEDSISHSRPHCGQGDTGNHAGVAVAVAIHHFVLLKVFDCPAQLRGAASARFCYLVTQMEVFNFKSRDLSEQPRLLLSVPLQTVMAVKQKKKKKAEVRCVVSFAAKMAT